MFLCWTKHLLRFTLTASAVFLLLTQCCEGQYQMVGPSEPIFATLGTDVDLPCQLEPPTDMTESTMEWARSDLSPRFVHLRHDGVDLMLNQHPLYMGRTYLSLSKLKQGDLSLRVSTVQLSDEGIYRCMVPGKASAEVHLYVGVASAKVTISAEADESSEGMLLGCESAGWYPKPKLLWLDSDGKPLPAGPQLTRKGPDGLFIVSSRVAVEKRPSNTFSCQVQQSNISQSRTADFSINVEEFKDSFGSTVRVIIVLVSAVGFIILSSGLFRWWKLKLNKKSNKEPNNQEEQGLVTKKTSTEEDEKEKELDDVIKTSTEEDEEEIKLDDVINQLNKLVKELEDLKELQMLKLKELEKMIEMDKMKPKKKGGSMSKEQLKFQEEKKKNLENVLKLTEDKLEKIKKNILIIARQKEKAEAEIQQIEGGNNQTEGGQEEEKELDGGNLESVTNMEAA